MAESQTYRKKFFFSNLLFLVICLFILLMVFSLSDLLSGAKIDVTEDQIYTTSPSTKEILSGLIDKVQVNYYVSEDLPSLLQDLKRDTRDLFEEFKELSGGMFQYSITDPEKEADEEAARAADDYLAARERGEEPKEPTPVQTIQHIMSGRQAPKPEDIRQEREKLAQELAKQREQSKDQVYRELLVRDFKNNVLQKKEQEGIRPFPFTETEASSVRQVNAFTSISVRYLDREPEVIPIHYSIEGLEYELASRILKLTQEEKPVVAFFDSRRPQTPPPNPMNPQQPPPSDYQGIEGFLEQFFEVRKVDLKEGDAIDDLVKQLKADKARKEREAAGDDSDPPVAMVEPEDLRKFISCLVIAQPDNLEPRQVYEINRAVSLGVPAIFFVSRYSLDISETGLREGVPVAMLSPGTEFEDMLRDWGIEMGSEMLATNPPNTATVELPQRLPNSPLVIMMARPLNVCLAPGNNEINQEHPLTNRIPQIIFPATTGVMVRKGDQEKKGLQSEVLAKTPESTWSAKIDPFARLQNPLQRQRGVGASLFDYSEELLSNKNPETFQDFLDSPMSLAVLVSGKLTFTFEGESVPDWKEEPEAPGGPGGMPGLPGGFPGGFPGGLPGLGSGDELLDAEDPQDSEDAPEAPEAGSETAPASDAGGADAEPAEEAPKAHVEPVEGRVLVLASADMVKNSFLMQRSREYQTNISFFQSAVETFGLGDVLLKIRRKQLTVRRFEPGSDEWYKWIIGLNVFVVPAVTALCGLAYFFYRRGRGVAYERKFIR